jgi:hypothetical protein
MPDERPPADQPRLTDEPRGKEALARQGPADPGELAEAKDEVDGESPVV